MILNSPKDFFTLNLKWEIGCFSYFVAIVVYVDNAVNQSADESSNMIGRIWKQESNQRLAIVCWVYIIYF